MDIALSFYRFARINSFVLILVVAECKFGYAIPNDELAGFRDCAISNAEGWKQYDILIKHEFFQLVTGGGGEGISEDGRLGDGCRTIRFAVDFEKNDCFCFELLEIPPNAEEKSLARRSIGRGYMMVNGVAYSRSFPGGTNGIEGKRMDLQTILKNAGVPDLRCLGLLEFPTEFKDEGVGMSFAMVQKQRTRSDFGPVIDRSKVKPMRQNVAEKDGSIQIAMSREGARFAFHFDSKSLMPLLSAASRVVDGVVIPEMEESFSWKEIGGIFVPTMYQREVTEFVDLVKKSRTSFETVQVHWFSLNEPIDRKLLDPIMIHDLSKLRRLVDQKSLGIDLAE